MHHATVRGCRIGVWLTILALALYYTWHGAVVTPVTQLFAVALAVGAVIGYGAPPIAGLVQRAICEEVAKMHRQLLGDIDQRLRRHAVDVGTAVYRAREEGERDGALQARLGRVAGGPPRPRPRQLRSIDAD